MTGTACRIESDCAYSSPTKGRVLGAVGRRLVPHVIEATLPNYYLHVRQLPLARTHADGGKALQQLAAVESLLAGVLQILNREVLIEVDELSAAWMAEDRKGVRRALERRGPRALRRLGAKPKPARRLLARRAPVG